MCGILVCNSVCKRGLAMARKLEMTWNAKRRGWLKHYRGRIYNVSCRQLGVEPTKRASGEAANGWWVRKKLEVDAHPEQELADEARQAEGAFRVWSLLRDFDRLDSATKAHFI